MIRPLLTLPVVAEEHVVRARQVARQIAELLGFERQDQTRIATAVSEIARNTLVYGRGGRAELALEGTHPQQMLSVRFVDTGPGIRDIAAILEGRYASQSGMGMGILGARRLMDSFTIDCPESGGTVVAFGKRLPADKPTSQQDVAALLDRLPQPDALNPQTELEAQHRELLRSLSELKTRQEEIGKLSTELEDTNRGVMALYAELDQRAEDLRQASEVKTRFLSNMSHEFRTPLNSILALSRMLLDRTDGDLNDEQERQVRYIRQSAQALTQMVNDLLDIAKVEAGKVDVVATEFSVTELFGALRGVMRPLLHDDKVELVFQEHAAIGLLHTDEGKVSQILRNLISNALKFTAHGEIRVSAELRGPDCIVFEVADTGIGIAEHDIDRIFDEFTQVNSPLQSRTKGSGLGLPLSRKLAELLGGTLTVRSVQGSGSTFSLTLPSVLRDAAMPGNRPDKKGVPPRRVLIVDDQETSRYVLRQLLPSDVPLELSEADNGTDGLSRAQRDQPDLVLLDLDLPGLNGFEVFRTLSTDPATRHIPIVVVTSAVLTGKEQERLAGAGGILSKATLSRPLLAAVLSDVWAQIGAA